MPEFKLGRCPPLDERHFSPSRLLMELWRDYQGYEVEQERVQMLHKNKGNTQGCCYNKEALVYVITKLDRMNA
jgi:hypothetical protein